MRRKFTMIGMGVAILMTVLYACKKDTKSPDSKLDKVSKIVAEKCLSGASSLATQSTSPYNVYLYKITDNGDGTYTWEWRVRNLNPGNGTGGTVQDLSHWDISLGDCVTIADVVSGATSTDGVTWNPFTPKFEVDKSQSCFTDKILKFDLGTTGTNISYYRLTINKNVSHTAVMGIYKSGANTGCGSLETCGFGCE